MAIYAINREKEAEIAKSNMIRTCAKVILAAIPSDHKSQEMTQAIDKAFHQYRNLMQPYLEEDRREVIAKAEQVMSEVKGQKWKVRPQDTRAMEARARNTSKKLRLGRKGQLRRN